MADVGLFLAYLSAADALLCACAGVRSDEVGREELAKDGAGLPLPLLYVSLWELMCLFTLRNCASSVDRGLGVRFRARLGFRV